MASNSRFVLIINLLFLQLSFCSLIQREEWQRDSRTWTRSTRVSKPRTTQRAASTAIARNSQVSSSSNGLYWKPAAGSTWQIQLSGSVIETTYNVDVYDIDLVDTPSATIGTLHSSGKKVICYFSAGSFESWRPDAGLFKESDKGRAMEGWPGEWWLNINSANVRSIMASRIALAATKGCDGIDPDNVDGYINDNGLGLTTADAISYLGFLATTAHSHGLAIGLKNAGGLVGSVLNIMDFHVNEQCLEYQECQMFQPFINAGKPVFHIEYTSGAVTSNADAKEVACSAVSASGFSTVLKKLDLSAWVEMC